MAKVALVTGGARGIGHAIAEDLAQDHRVAVTWRTAPPVALPPGALPIEADLAEHDRAESVVSQVVQHFGRLDVIVNNAGIIATSPLDKVDPATLRRLLDVNLLAAHALLAAALPHLRAGAAVVNISSVNAVLPPEGAAIYGASKAALDLWTRGMAKELGPRRIRVNAVAPGAVENADAPRPDDLVRFFVKDTALGRLATPADIAAAIRFLASDAAACITGEVLTVSGGYRL